MITDPNAVAYQRMIASHPWLVGVRPAAEVVPGMRPNLILHAAPPARWEDMSAVLRGGMIGAALFEGLARTPEEASEKAQSDAIAFGAAQDHGSIAGGVGSITASMPVMVVEDRSSGAIATHFVMEGLGRTLVSGFYDTVVLDRLRWLRDSFAPMLDAAIRAIGGVNLREMMAEALCRGDELHNRNRAGTSMFMNAIVPGLIEVGTAAPDVKRALAFLAGNPQFFVGATLPAAALMLRAARDIPGSCIVTAIGANGRDCGIQVGGLPDRWFVAPCDVPNGLLHEGVSQADVGPGCGDSFVLELAGFGASVLPAAPALGPVIGATLADGVHFAEAAYGVAIGEHPDYKVPALGFRGIPVGFDARKVVTTGTLPVIDIAMSHREPGMGMIGMGVVSPPMACFEQAVNALGAAHHT
jgi:Protein of unknown function (DUF1116)